MASINPAAPKQVIGHIALGTTMDVVNAVAAARTAFPKWSRTPVEERSEFLERLAAKLRANRYELAAWEVFEVGKTWSEADADVVEAIDFCSVLLSRNAPSRPRATDAGRARRSQHRELCCARSRRHHCTLEFSARHSLRHDGRGSRHWEYGSDQTRGTVFGDRSAFHDPLAGSRITRRRSQSGLRHWRSCRIAPCRSPGCRPDCLHRVARGRNIDLANWPPSLIAISGT